MQQMGKTVFAISHDDHYFQHADRLLEMRAGQLAELTGEERNRLPAMRWPVRPDSQRAPGKARAPLKFSASTSLTVIISPSSRYA